MSRTTTGRKPTATPRQTRGKAMDKDRSRRAQLITAVLVALAVVGLFFAFRSGQDHGTSGGKAAYQVGQPGQGQVAPAFTLPASTGKSVALSSYRGKSVLLFFQEGIGCQPCWDQIRDLEKDHAKLAQAGIDAVVSITTSPTDLVAQKTRDDGLSTPVLTDADLSVSRAYEANQFGMMGDSRDGHSFILVGPNGVIRWRADYGGAPNYTMYLPVDKMLSDMRAMMSGSSPQGMMRSSGMRTVLRGSVMSDVTGTMMGDWAAAGER